MTSAIRTFSLLAPAKLNLYLRVVGKRPDDYHELETVFERLDLADELTFDDAPREILLSCSHPSLSCGEDNLVMQTARLLQRATGTTRGARMHLEKRIPVAAGLGGGSSDAATTLIGLDRLWKTNCSAQQLHELAAQLGSDVPVFLIDAPFAIGRGRGELLEPVEVTTVLHHVLVTPNVPLSTKEMFAEADFNLTAVRPSSTIVVHALRNGSLGELAQALWNDLAPAAIRRCPLIQEIQRGLLDAGCLGAGMSGSGPSVFGLCGDRQQAETIARQMQQRFAAWFVRVVRTFHNPL